MNFSKFYSDYFTATLLEWEHLQKPDQCKDIIVFSLQFLVNEKRIIFCGFVIMINGVYFAQLWLPLLQSLLQLFESSNELQTMSAAEKKKQIQEEADEDELLIGLDDTPGK